MYELNNIGIYLNSYNTGNHKTFCPKCKNIRKKQNTHDKPLSVSIEKDVVLYKCHNCDWTGVLSDKKYTPVTKKSVKIPTPTQTNKDKLYKWFQERSISKETVDALDIYESNNQICFPYKKDGKTVNVKYRTYDKRFKQHPNAQRTLFNIDSVKEHWEKTGEKNIIICEGEMDVISYYEIGIKYAVTLPDGASKVVKYDLNDLRFRALQNCDFLNDVEKVFIATDQDEAGECLHRELVHRFGKDRSFSIQFPNQLGDVVTKDANECLTKFGKSELEKTLKTAKPYPIDGIYTIQDYKKDIYDMYDGKTQKPLSTGFGILDMIYKIQPATFHVVTGVPNHGKSNFLDQIAVNLNQMYGWKFAIFSPEHSTPQHIRRVVEKIAKKGFDIGSQNRMNKEELKNSLRILNNNFYFMENKDKIPNIEWILEKAKQSILKFGVKGVIIDPYSEINSTREGNKREDEHIRDIISKAKKFARTHEIVLWMVAHPSKLPRDNGKINPPTLYDISGSAHWNNLSDVGIVIHRDFDNQKTQVIVRKVREQGLYGNIGECFFEFDLQERVYKEFISEQDNNYWYNDA